MFSLRNKKKLSFNYPQYPLLSGALKTELDILSLSRNGKKTCLIAE